MSNTEPDDTVAPDGGRQIYDVLIIGGGPAGATAALYSARAGLSTLVLDKGLTAGALGMTSRIANYPGIRGVIDGAQLVATMRQQAQEAGARFAGERVLMATITNQIKEAHTAQNIYEGRAMIIATGAMGRAHAVPGEEALLGRGVSYCAVCDGAFFEGQEVAVAGNNDEAVEEALYLARLARRVYLLVHTPTLHVGEALAREAEAHANVEVRLNHRLRQVLGDGEVTGVRVAPQGGEEYTLEVPGVFVYLQGNRPVTDFLYGQLPTTEQGCLEVDAHMQTRVPGVFAVGDLLCNHVKQAVIAAADGAIAGMAVQRYLSGRERLRPDWA